MIRARRRLALAAAGLAAALGAVAGPAAPASAHAALEETTPEAGAVLDVAPTQVVLRFSESVGIPSGAVRVYDQYAETVAVGTPSHGGLGGSSILADLPSLADGVYVVTWRAISADSHPVSGAFSFTVGQPTGVDPGQVLARVTPSPQRTVSWTYGVARAAMLAALAGLVGFAAFPLVTGWDRRSPRWWHWTRGLAACAALAATVALALQVPSSAGRGFAAVGRAEAWRALLSTTAGRAGVVRATLLVVAAVTVWLGASSVRRYAASTLAPVAAVVVASAFAGHGASGRWVAAGVVLTVLHTLAMGLWFGGLVALVVLALVRPEVDRVRAERTVARFSSVAFACVAVLVVTGFAQAVRQLPGLDGLTGTSFGRLLLVKTAVVAVMVGAAALSRRIVRGWWLWPRSGAHPGLSGRSLRPPVLVEVVLGLVVLGVTSGLMVANPNGSSAAGSSVEVRVQDDAVVVSLFVEPDRAGVNQIHVTLLDPTLGAAEYDEVTLRASLPGQGIAPFSIPLEHTGRNHFASSAAVFPVRGRWQLEIGVLVSEFDRRIFHTTVRIH